MSTEALTETELIKRLRAKYGEKAGNGVAYAVVPGVRSAAGFDARRTIDAFAMSLWPSRGLSLTAFEIKSSRSDWLREMREPAKAEEFCELADYFYLVVGDAKIVQDGELPETWGLIVPHGKGLRVAVDAPRLRPVTVNGGQKADGRSTADLPPAFTRSFLAALLRSATAIGSAEPAEIVAARNEAWSNAEQIFGSQAEAAQAKLDEVRGQLLEFTEASGINPLGYRWPSHDPKEVGAAVKLVLDGNHKADILENRLTRIREEALRIAASAEELATQ